MCPSIWKRLYFHCFIILEHIMCCTNPSLQCSFVISSLRFSIGCQRFMTRVRKNSINFTFETDSFESKWTFINSFCIFILHLDKEEDSFNRLKQINRICEWMWPIFFKFVLAGYCVCTVITSIVSILYSYIAVGHFDTNNVYYPYKFV